MFVDLCWQNPGQSSAEFYIALLVSELIRQNLGKVNIIGGYQPGLVLPIKKISEAVSGKIRACGWVFTLLHYGNDGPSAEIISAFWTTK